MFKTLPSNLQYLCTQVKEEIKGLMNGKETEMEDQETQTSMMKVEVNDQEVQTVVRKVSQ